MNSWGTSSLSSAISASRSSLVRLQFRCCSFHCSRWRRCQSSSSSRAARDVIKNDFGGKLPSGHPFRPDVRVYPADGFLPSADAVKTASARMLVCVCVDTSASARMQPRSARTLVCVRADIAQRPRGCSCASARTRARPHGRSPASARTRKKKKLKKKN
jgi:hypothetical protein